MILGLAVKLMRCLLLLLAVGIMSAASGDLQAAAPPPQRTGAAAPSVTPQRALLDQYCVTCHNEKIVRGRSPAPTPLVSQLRTAGLALDSLDLARVGEDADYWEKVVRKLRSGAMPPIGRPRPDDGAVDTLASWLETELDRAAAAAPNPGRQLAVRRLTRTEYQHAIRDLLALEDLPQEMDLSVLLPPDSSASGFDNVADVLFVSPTLLEAYLSAAQKISRLAVGDPTMPLSVNTYTLPLELPQDAWFDELPFGTRGGTAIRSHFPLDGEYVVELELGGRVREPHQIEVSVDGARMHLFTVDAPEAPAGTGLPAEVGQADARLHVRLPVAAGPRVVGVTFLEKTSAPGQELRRPFRRSRGQLPSIARVTISGPFAASGAGDTPSRRRIFVCDPSNASEETPCAKQILSTLAGRAHRRAATEADLQMLLPFYDAGHGEGGFEAGIQRALERLLVSPEFLFRIEREPADIAPNTVYRITDLELASRLSFFLWSSVPDEELLDVATEGGLQDPAVLDRQVRRMLVDQRSETLASNFAAQWLYLRDLEVKRPDDRLFPNFDKGLQQAMLRETELFVDHILREDRSVLDLMRSDTTFVNERLAKHYGIPHVYGSHFRRITLDDSPRRGLLSQGSILTLTSRATRTSPVLRGKWILDNILSSPPPPAPPNVPALQDTSAEGKVLSMRERMVQHRANPVCASCHQLMDPLGFALENFDAVGGWRTHGESGAPLDVSAALPNGTAFEGFAELTDVLLSTQSEAIVITVAEKLLTYALGRNLESYDAPVVRSITRAAAQSDYRFSSLVLGIVKSTPFQMRKSAS
jgi:mono/diheme cytochrome c family protein